jgi:hypothetical protein
MARTAYARRECYDNIAVGSAISTQERVLPDASGVAAGVLPPTKDRVTFAHGERVYSATPGLERFISGTAGATGERPGGA